MRIIANRMTPDVQEFLHQGQLYCARDTNTLTTVASLKDVAAHTDFTN